MKHLNKLLFLAVLLMGCFAYSQSNPVVGRLRFTPQGAPDNPIKGEVYASSIGTGLFYYTGAQWIDLTVPAEGSTYAAGTGLDLTGTLFSVVNSELLPEWANISGKPVNLDLDSTDDMTTAHEANNINGTDITNLDNLSGINTGDETAAAIKTKLETLIGTARLNASAIEGIPSELSNDFVTGGSVTGEDLTLTVPNQASPVIDMSAFALDSDLAGAGTDDQTAAEVAFTPTSPISATNVQAAIEELGSEKAEDDEVVKLTGDQTIAGLKTFNQDIILSNSGSFQFQSIDNLSRYDFASFADGFRIVPQTRPTTGDLYVDGDYFQFDEANLRWEIDDSPIITQANAASLGVGGGGSDTSLSDTDQTIPDATTRIINTENLGELSFRQFGTELMRLGGNNDNALLVGALEGLTGNVVFRSPIEPLNLPIASNDASLFSGGIIKDSGKLYFSDGTDWVDLGADPLAPTVIADGYTITAADGNANKVFEYNGVTDIDVSFPDVFDVGDKVSFRQLNSGKIRIEYTGTGTGDGIDFQTYDANGSAQVYKGNYAYVNEGNWELYVPSSNAYVGANAANPDNEVNGFAGTRNTTGAAGVIISSTTTTPAPTNGTYALKLERKNGGGDADMYIELTGLVTGTEYTVTFDAIELVTQNEFFIQTPASDWTEGLTQTFVNSLTWTEMGFTMTPLVDDPEIRVVGLGVLLGDSVAIDNIMAIPTGN